MDRIEVEKLAETTEFNKGNQVVYGGEDLLEPDAS